MKLNGKYTLKTNKNEHLQFFSFCLILSLINRWPRQSTVERLKKLDSLNQCHLLKHLLLELKFSYGYIGTGVRSTRNAIRNRLMKPTLGHHKLKIAQRAMELVIMCGSLSDNIRIEMIQQISKVTDIFRRISTLKWKWSQELKFAQVRPRLGKCSSGRPKARRTDTNWIKWLTTNGCKL